MAMGEYKTFNCNTLSAHSDVYVYSIQEAGFNSTVILNT